MSGREFPLLMISAMYENGGNTTHRFLDGHPQLYVYPFESQLGTRLVNDQLASVFPVKYRWPVFALDATSYDDYKGIIDEEGKVRARTPEVSKFRHQPFEMSDDERCAIYQRYVTASGRSRANNVAAFFQATFDAWRNYTRSGREKVYVGYSPIVIVDGDKILSEMTNAHLLHVVRNPWSAYADTKKRPVPLSLANYVAAWSLNQYYALLFRDLFPDRVHILRIEDVLSDPRKTIGKVCQAIGVGSSETLETPTWNGKPLTEIYPWGTIRKPTSEANRETANELSALERDAVTRYAKPYLESFDYVTFLK